MFYSLTSPQLEKSFPPGGPCPEPHVPVPCALEDEGLGSLRRWRLHEVLEFGVEAGLS